MKSIRITFALLVAISAATALANPSGDWVVVVPINPGTLAGANGTQWVTSLWVSNASDHDTLIDCDDPGNCPVLRAHSTLQLPAAPYRNLTHDGFLRIATGLLLNVPADAISVELRTTDSITAPHSAGTEIPVARPSDFKKTVLTLPHVPMSDHSRASLRLYGTANGEATVHVFDAATGAELSATTVSLTGGTVSNSPFGSAFPTPPSYASVALPLTANPVRIEVVPGSGLAIWGFASVTDNVSEQFTIVSPAAGFDYFPVSVA